MFAVFKESHHFKVGILETGVCHEGSVRCHLAEVKKLTLLLCHKMLWDCTNVIQKTNLKLFCSLIADLLMN
jgi:hypothetical protein